jgi:TonB family protein
LSSPRTLAPAKAGWPLVVSLGAHVALLSAAGWLAYRSLAAREARSMAARTEATVVVALELPSVSDGVLLDDRDEIVQGAAPSAHGGATVARVDTGTPGRGGAATGAPAVNLAADDDGLVLSPDLLSRLDREQMQRLATARARASREDRRATTNPMELTFLASGKGEHPERRPSAEADPSRGSLVAPRASVRGGRVGARADDADPEGAGRPAGAARPGQVAASPGLGVRDGEPGADHSARARVAFGRPAVTEGPVTIPSTLNGRPHDTIDSEQEVASTVRSLVHASVAGGLAGPGRGGSPGPEAETGAGGAAGRGSVARALGAGDGDVFDWSTSDPALVPYFRAIHARVDPLWRDAFPRSAMLELKQGTVILEFTVAADGAVRVSWPPARPSGIDEFDRNCAEALRRASPLPAIPASLRREGRTLLRIRAPFVARNPIIK